MNDIRQRLDNWGRAQNGSGRRDDSCMTGLICERLRRARCGNVYTGVQARQEIDEADAELVNKAWMALRTTMHSTILKRYYVDRWDPRIICRRLQIKVYPTTVFDFELRRAESAIQQLLDNMQQKHIIKINNSIPSLQSARAQVGAALLKGK